MYFQYLPSSITLCFHILRNISLCPLERYSEKNKNHSAWVPSANAHIARPRCDSKQHGGDSEFPQSYLKWIVNFQMETLQYSIQNFMFRSFETKSQQQLTYSKNTVLTVWMPQMFHLLEMIIYFSLGTQSNQTLGIICVSVLSNVIWL